MTSPARLGGDEGRVLRPFPLRRVIMLGGGASVYDWIRKCYVDYDGGRKEDTQVWGICAMPFALKCDLAWNIHTKKVLLDAPEVGQKGVDKLAKLDCPIVACEPFADNVYEYPLAEVIELTQETYLMNTLAYAIAFALLCGVERIEFYGCDFNYRTTGQQYTDYEMGRACVEYWIGVFRHFRQAGGRLVGVGPLSHLMDTNWRLSHGIYGYGEAQPIIQQDGTGKVTLVGFNKPTISDEEFDSRVGNDV